MWFVPDDPIIQSMERTGYPPWIDDNDDNDDEEEEENDRYERA